MEKNFIKQAGAIAIKLSVLLWMVCICFPVAAQTLTAGQDAVITCNQNNGFYPGRVAMIRRVATPTMTTAPFVNTNYWITPQVLTANWDFNHIGQVFGVAINNQGDVYFAATALYDINATSWNSTLDAASPLVSPSGSYANPAGGNAGIYKADKTNLSNVMALVTTVNAATFASVGTSKIPNLGYGIGNIAVSNAHNKLYATNLEDGKIYALNYTTGIISSVFDPFTADPGTSQIAEIGERLFAVAVNKEFDGTTRVYYSRLVKSGAIQNEIWSVEVNASGDFIPATNSLEIQLSSLSTINFISDIAFSVRGEMAVAEKGDNHKANGYVFFGRHNAWSLPVIPRLSTYNAPANPSYNSAGGVDFANFIKTSPVQDIISCDSLAWFSVNAMNVGTASLNYGYQSLPYNGYINNTVPAFKSEAHFIPLDATIPSAYWKTNFGDIEIRDGDCPSAPTDICNSISVEGDMDACCLNLKIRNSYADNYFSAVIVKTNTLNISGNTNGSTWGASTIVTPDVIKFSQYQTYIPKTDSFFQLSKLCFDGAGADVLTLYFIGTAPQYDTVCIKTIDLQGCGVPVDTNCVGLIQLDDTCINGVPNLKFQIRNHSSFTMRGLTIIHINPNIKIAADNFYPITDLAPNATSPVYTAPLTVLNNDTAGCFYFSACDVNVRPGTTGPTPNFCCIDSIPYCITLGKCEPCDALAITAQKADSVNCCYKLTLENYYVNNKIGCIRFRGIAGTQFSLLSGWAISSPVSSNNITICPPGTGLLTGTFVDFASFCLTGTSVPPYRVAIDIYDADGKLICTKDMQFNNCQLAKPTCANIVNDSLYCDGKNTKLKFSIRNNSPFTIYQSDIRLSDTAVLSDTDRIIPTPPIAPGGTGDPYEITLTKNHDNVDHVCIYLTAHNAVYTDSTSATICCTDSLGVICLPFLSCDSSGSCCVFEGMKLPTGITPNGDGFNDTWIIQNAQICKQIKITVFNRWGNIVYKDDNYANNWAGTNSSGKKLAQGTYYVVIELSGGAKKAMYLDIRY